MITISTDKNLLDIAYIHQFLNNTYWANGRTMEKVQGSINNSLCFGMYLNGKQIGFARIVTDTVLFSYLADVFIDDKHQGKLYGENLLTEIYNHIDLKNVSTHYLITKDAQTFYTKLGFSEYPTPDRFMIKR